jgi:hypothetical protein
MASPTPPFWPFGSDPRSDAAPGTTPMGAPATRKARRRALQRREHPILAVHRGRYPNLGFRSTHLLLRRRTLPDQPLPSRRGGWQ